MTAPDDVVDVSPARPSRRPGRTTAIVAVLAVLVALGGVVTWVATRGGSSGAAGGSAACPIASPRLDGSTSNSSLVPATPTASGTDGRLVPDRAPDAVLLCEYQGLAVIVAAPADGDRLPITTGDPDEPLPLGRSAELDGADADVATLVTTLRGTAVESGENRVCDLPAPGPGPTHLVGLTYADGVVWLATPGFCAGTTNGVADAAVAIAPDVSLALDAATGGATDPSVTMSAVPPATVSAAPAPDPTGSSPDASGFPGTSGDPGSGFPATDVPLDPFAACTPSDDPAADASVLLPFTPVDVLVCHAAVDPSVASPVVTHQDASVAVALADALLALPALPPDTVCTAIGGEAWRLLFTAADGRAALVDVDTGGCGTASNGVVTAGLDDTVVALLTALG